MGQLLAEWRPVAAGGWPAPESQQPDLLRLLGVSASEARARLSGARLALLGLAGPGAHAALALAAAGVGSLVLLDPFPCQPGDLPLLPFGAPESVGRTCEQVALAGLQSSGVALETAGGPPSREQVARLAAGCQLLICCFDRGFAAAHHWANRASLAAGVPALHAECTAQATWLGPLVRPSYGACYLCYRMRVVACADDFEAAMRAEELLDRQRAPALHLRGVAPAQARYAGTLLALEALRLLLGLPAGPLESCVVELGQSGRQTRRHAVLPHPACPVCGRRSPTSPLQPALGELAQAGGPPGDLLAAAPQLVSPRTGLVRGLSLVPPAPGDPALPHLVSAELSNSRLLRHAPLPGRLCGGKGLSLREAMLSALGEALERSAASLPTSEVVYARMAELPGQALDPRRLVLFAPEQYAHLPYAPYTEASELGWARMRSLVGGGELFVPALAIDMHHQPRQPAEWLFQPTSNGLAAGATLAGATLAGACEVLERDAFVASWLHRLPGQALDPLSHPDPELAELCALHARHGLEFRLHRLPTLHACHVFLAISLQAGVARGPFAAVGLGADLDARLAARKALLEAAQVRHSLRQLIDQPAVQQRMAALAADPRLVATLEDHALLYAHPASRAALGFLLEQPIEPYCWPAAPALGAVEQIERLAGFLRAEGSDLLYRNLTPPELAGHGLHVVRVLIPDLQPIDFGWAGRRLGGARLFQLPRRLGLAQADATPAQLNPYLHPLA